MYKALGIDLCYCILATDHSYYYDQAEYPTDTFDFDFRNGKSYKSGTILKYKTEKPYGLDVILKKDYHFKWDKVNDLYFSKLEV